MKDHEKADFVNKMENIMGNPESVKICYPDAICEPFFNGPGGPDGYEIWTSSTGEVLGSGKTQVEAWADAANKLKPSTFKDWWQEHGSLDYEEMCQAKAAWDGALEQVIPRLYEMLKCEVIVGSVVNFETVRKAAIDLKST